MSRYNDREIYRLEAIERAAIAIHDRDTKLVSGAKTQEVPTLLLALLEEALYPDPGDGPITITITISRDDAYDILTRKPNIPPNEYPAKRVIEACRAALEAGTE